MYAKALCSTHYKRKLTTGSTDLRPREPRFCEVDGCDRPHAARGLCEMHYGRLARTGHVGPANTLIRSAQGTCNIEGCGKKAYAKDLCRVHYENNRLRGDPLATGPGQGYRPPKWDGVTCSIEGCERRAHLRGWCAMHYGRWQRKGDPGPAGRLRAEHGSGSVSRDGYRMVPDPNRPGKTIAEHRLVMQQMIGRALLPHENVHHINGVRDDNRPENLELWSKWQPCGQRVEDKVAWAREILDLYGDLIDRMNASTKEMV